MNPGTPPRVTRVSDEVAEAPGDSSESAAGRENGRPHHAGHLGRDGGDPSRRPEDLVSASEAARAIGFTAEGIRQWIETRRITDYGRGPRRARLVSLAEVLDVADWRARSITLGEAAALLHMSTLRVRELCDAADLPFRRFSDAAGSGYEIDRRSVEELAARRAAERERLVTTADAMQISGWPRWVIDKFRAEALLTAYDGEWGAILVDRGQLNGLLERFAANPDRCPHCQRELPPGRRWHKGECAGAAAAAWLKSPAGVEARARAIAQQMG